MVIYLEKASDFDALIKEGVVLVDFFAEWCGPCRMLGPVLDDVSKELSDVKILKVDVDKFGVLAQQFSIHTIPTMKLFKDGSAVATKVGFLAKEPLIRFISM